MTENSGSLKRGLDSGPDIERTMFFSDAVFAIAMTLLAVDIRRPMFPPTSWDRPSWNSDRNSSPTPSPSPLREPTG